MSCSVRSTNDLSPFNRFSDPKSAGVWSPAQWKVLSRCFSPRHALEVNSLAKIALYPFRLRVSFMGVRHMSSRWGPFLTSPGTPYTTADQIATLRECNAANCYRPPSIGRFAAFQLEGYSCRNLVRGKVRNTGYNPPCCSHRIEARAMSPP